MKKQIKLRGVWHDIDDEKKEGYTILVKPRFNKFSISDKVIEDYVMRRNYIWYVSLPDGSYFTIDKDTDIHHTEEVETKFEGCLPWRRYWYQFGPKTVKTMI